VDTCANVTPHISRFGHVEEVCLFVPESTSNLQYGQCQLNCLTYVPQETNISVMSAVDTEGGERRHRAARLRGRAQPSNSVDDAHRDLADAEWLYTWSLEAVCPPSASLAWRVLALE
jgi:hypothetical protein